MVLRNRFRRVAQSDPWDEIDLDLGLVEEAAPFEIDSGLALAEGAAFELGPIGWAIGGVALAGYEIWKHRHKPTGDRLQHVALNPNLPALPAPKPSTKFKPDPDRVVRTSHLSNRAISMAYRRYKRKRSYRRRRPRRRVRRRRRTGRRMVASLGVGGPPKFQRMRHRLDTWTYLSAGIATGAKAHTDPYRIFDSQQGFDIKLNTLHDAIPATNVTATAVNASTTQRLPLFYETMSGLYKKYKVNNVYAEITFINNRPTFTASGTADEEVISRATEPVIVGIYPVDQSIDAEADLKDDDAFGYRAGAKTALLASQRAHTFRVKLNPARVLGLSNSFDSADYIPANVTSDPTKVAALRCVWTPMTTLATGNISDHAVSVFARIFWDVTWAGHDDTADHVKPAAT